MTRFTVFVNNDSGKGAWNATLDWGGRNNNGQPAGEILESISTGLWTCSEELKVTKARLRQLRVFGKLAY